MSLPDRGPARKVQILIAGAGVGGLVTALECWRHGFDVRVLERTKTNSTLGDSFTIWSSAMRIIKNHWPGLWAESCRLRYESLVTHHVHTGEKIAGPSSFLDALPKPLVEGGLIDADLIPRHSRPKFHGILLAQLQRIGIEVEYDNEVVEYFEDAKTSRAGVVTRHGSRFEADLVVAADGLRGQSWKLVGEGNPVPAKSSGDAMFRVAFARSLVEHDEAIMERFGKTIDGQTIMELWGGPGMYAGFWLNEDHMFWTISRPDPGDAEESWSHRVSPAKALAFTKTIPGWPDYADRVIAATPENAVVDWKLMWRDPQPHWVSPAGRVVLVGDAAHTFLPSSGNGATQAIEDAASLATCLSLALDQGVSIPEALRVHNLLRFQRVSFLQAMGIKVRDDRDSKKNKGDNKKMVVAFQDWLVMHDPERYAQERFLDALQCVRIGKEGDFKHTSGVPKTEYIPWTIDGLMAAVAKGEPTVLDGGWC